MPLCFTETRHPLQSLGNGEEGEGCRQARLQEGQWVFVSPVPTQEVCRGETQDGVSSVRQGSPLAGTCYPSTREAEAEGV